MRLKQNERQQNPRNPKQVRFEELTQFFPPPNGWRLELVQRDNFFELVRHEVAHPAKSNGILDEIGPSSDTVQEQNEETQDQLPESSQTSSKLTAEAVPHEPESPQDAPPLGKITRLASSGEAYPSRHEALGKTPIGDSLGPSIEPEILLIPAGDFLLGSQPWRDEHARQDEQPQTSLYLPDYWLARTPVTNAQYAAFVAATERRGWQPPPGKENHPAVNVSWHDAKAYCRWLAQLTGRLYRLPTEPEWEKGARGTDGRIWPWGDQWVRSGCNSLEERNEDTTAVDAYAESPSPHGLLDMVGNVGEWTHTKWGPDPAAPLYAYPYRSDDGREDPAGPDHRVVRGGCWLNHGRLVRCSRRFGGQPSDGFGNLGFRVAASPQF